MSRQRSCEFRFHGVDVLSFAPTGQRTPAQGRRIRVSGSRRPGFVYHEFVCPNGARESETIGRIQHQSDGFYTVWRISTVNNCMAIWAEKSIVASSTSAHPATESVFLFHSVLANSSCRLALSSEQQFTDRFLCPVWALTFSLSCLGRRCAVVTASLAPGWYPVPRWGKLHFTLSYSIPSLEME